MPSYIYLSTIYLSLKYTDLARVNTLQLRGRVVLEYHSWVCGNTEQQDNLPQPGTGFLSKRLPETQNWRFRIIFKVEVLNSFSILKLVLGIFSVGWTIPNSPDIWFCLYYHLIFDTLVIFLDSFQRNPEKPGTWNNFW